MKQRSDKSFFPSHQVKIAHRLADSRGNLKGGFKERPVPVATQLLKSREEDKEEKENGKWSFCLLVCKSVKKNES